MITETQRINGFLSYMEKQINDFPKIIRYHRLDKERLDQKEDKNELEERMLKNLNSLIPELEERHRTLRKIIGEYRKQFIYKTIFYF